SNPFQQWIYSNLHDNNFPFIDPSTRNLSTNQWPQQEVLCSAVYEGYLQTFRGTDRINTSQAFCTKLKKYLAPPPSGWNNRAAVQLPISPLKIIKVFTLEGLVFALAYPAQRMMHVEFMIQASCLPRKE